MFNPRATWFVHSSVPAFLRILSPLALVFLLGSATPTKGATVQPIRLALNLPQGSNYVIGDQIPLQWSFDNLTTQSLAFMWEGCCRVNGRVAMKRLSAPRPPTGEIRPSHLGLGQGIYNAACRHCKLARRDTELEVQTAEQGPATAHMFARAVRLNGGRTQVFPSTLENWVLLEQTGDYTLTGHYLGVHPRQQPQMPKRTQLWSGRTESGPINLSLLSVNDYLKEAAPRQIARGIRLTFGAPKAIRPFEKVALSITLENTTATNQIINWPGDASFWLVNSEGRRVTASRYAIGRFGSAITLRPNLPQEVTFDIDHELLSGQPFGEYRAFMELTQSTNQVRTPSNDALMHWQIDDAATKELLIHAAGHPAVGHRNPQLKLLRVYLLELADTLARMDLANALPKARSLLADLQQAALLKPHQKTPGRANINVRIDKRGAALQDPPLLKAFPAAGQTVSDALTRIAALRRHLGWSLGLNIRVSPDAPLASVKTFTKSLNPEQTPLAEPPSARLFNRLATGFTQIQFVDSVENSDGSTVIRVGKKNGFVEVKRATGPNAPSIGADDWPDVLKSHLAVDASPELTWGELRAAIEPIIGHQKLLELSISTKQ
jgi:hypothetical protein